MGHVGEPPAVRDFADGSMSLIRIFKSVAAAFKPPRLNELRQALAELDSGRVKAAPDSLSYNGHAQLRGPSQ